MPSLNREAYRIGWICPLEVEQIAAVEMLDEEHISLPQAPADHNVYTLGSINKHNVIIAGLPQPGNCSAATVVTQMRMSFPNLGHGLLVGIGGGVPLETESGMVRLGHVIVNKPTSVHSGVVQYDRGKAKDGYIERTGTLALPPAALLNAAQALAVERARMDSDPIQDSVQRIQCEDRPALRRFRYPGTANDHLYPRDYKHQQEGQSCAAAGCDPQQRIQRISDDKPIVHRGTIASGELLLRDAVLRDRLAEKHELLCFEMEATGALTDFPCLIIRGISDYCDSHKNDQWHGYAAAVAAAYARQLFFHLPEQQWGATSATFQLPSSVSDVFELPRFVARTEELSQMHDILKETTVGRRTVVLHGLGGIGKTQLVTEYSRSHRAEYSSVTWLNARDEMTLRGSFARFAQRILQHYPSTTYLSSAVGNKDIDQTTLAVKHWLDEPLNNRWLLIYDNYDHPISTRTNTGSLPNTRHDQDDTEDQPKAFDLRPYLPNTDHGAIIVTSRLLVKLGGSHSLLVGKLRNVNDSLKILTTGRENIKQDPAAIDLAQRLDGLPLALATAGAYLEQVSMTCAEYLELYDDSWLELQKGTPQLPSYDQTLYSTWNLSYRHIQRQSPIAAKLLQQWAFFDNEDLWYELLRQAGQDAKERKEWLVELTSNKLSFHGVMRILCNHGLVEADPPTDEEQLESRGYSVHGCVHSWMRYVLNRHFDEEMAGLALYCVVSHMPGRDQNKFWLTQRRLLGHAEIWRGLLRVLEAERFAEYGWKFLRLCGDLYADQGRLQDAESMLLQALHSIEDAPRPNDTSALNIVHSLSNIYARRGRFQDAEAMLQQALHVKEEVQGPEDAGTLSILNNLAAIYCDQGRLQDAEVLLQRVLDGTERASGPAHLSTLESIGNLGTLYAKLGQHQDAEPMLQKALGGIENIVGPDHLSALRLTNSLGGLYLSQGRLEEAEAMFQRALYGTEKALGPYHDSTLRILHNLGSLYSRQSRLQEAEAIHQRALVSIERELGSDHSLAIISINQLGALYLAQDRPQEAEAMYKRALEAKTKASEPDSKSTVSAVRQLGALYERQGRLREAEAMCKRLLDGTEKEFGPDHGETLFTVKKLGSLYLQQGRLREAEAMYKKVLQRVEKPWEMDRTLPIDAAHSMTMAYKDEDRGPDGEIIYKRAASGEGGLPDYMTTLGALRNLGVLYKSEGQLQEAETIWREALGGYEGALEETSATTHSPALIVIHDLATLYRESGRIDEAMVFYERFSKGWKATMGRDDINCRRSFGNADDTQGRTCVIL